MWSGRTIGLVCAVLMGAGCTVISGVGDFKASEDGGAEPTEGKDFEFTMSRMVPHATQNVDVALADGADRLLARAVVRMPPLADPYPDVSLVMPDALSGVEGRASVRFFADVNRNGEADEPGIDHSWEEPVPESGALKFAHNTMFDRLADFPLQPIGADFVLRFEEGTLDPRALLSRQKRVFEVRLSLRSDQRVVGLLQVHPDSETELPEEFRLSGIVDSGNTYDVRVFADGMLIDNGEITLNAPTEGDLVFTVEAPVFGLDAR